MALHTKKQFADECVITTKYLAVDIGRGNVITIEKFGEIYIDDEKEENAAYLIKKKELAAKRAAKQENKNENKSADTVQVELKLDSPNEKDEKEPENKKEKEFTDTNIGLLKLDKEKTSLENDKKREEIELLKMKRARMNGEVIPTDLVKNTFKQNNKSIASSFRQAADNFLTRIAAEKAISRTELAGYRGELVSMINRAIEEAVNISTNSIDQIVSEFSEKKGVGEREL